MQLSNDELATLLQKLTARTNKVLASYADELKRLNDNQVAQYGNQVEAYKAMEIQAKEIVDSREKILQLEQLITKITAHCFPEEALKVMDKAPKSN